MPSVLQHPGLDSRQARISYFALLFLRSLFFSLAIFIADGLVDLGLSNYILSGAAIGGVLAASWLAFTRINFYGFSLLGLAVYLSWVVLYQTFDYMQYGDNEHIFWFFNLAQGIDLCLLVFFLAAVSSWIFWKFKNAITVELLLLLTLSIYVLSGHRNFHFDMPRAVNTLAWDLGYEQLSLLVGIGAALVVLIVAYLFFATLPSKPIATWKPVNRNAHRTRANLFTLCLTISSFGLLVYLIADQVYRYYNAVALTRIANGVGLENREGMSPLGFHSALGGTNQPSGLVRLEGDYSENPFVPMLYLRESALSQFNGRELTIAKRIYDQDVSDTNPREAFVGKEDERLRDRKSVVQSIFLLTDHKDAFALDYPVKISQLKNPNPKRFKATYRAYSIAPTFKLTDLENGGIGDPDWSPETWQHYLEPHGDLRYTTLARELTAGINDPIQKILAITRYLDEKAIYTLTPNHQQKPNEDPVAPFLFGDLRGYCVHFSHATVYMLRALGIPARIGTGYLTDLSQAKDGHILLRMSDRHAWAEAYVTGRGWVPFDTHPSQVESHADSQVDMKLLEELMGMLEPGEEILPDNLLKDEPGIEAPVELYQPGARDLLMATLLALLLLVMRKVYLLYGWMIPSDSRSRLRRSYIAVLTMLHDLGYRRDLGETRIEFQRRISRELGSKTLSLTERLNRISYSGEDQPSLSPAEIDELRARDLEAIAILPAYRRLLALLNPASVFSTILGVRW